MAIPNTARQRLLLGKAFPCVRAPATGLGRPLRAGTPRNAPESSYARRLGRPAVLPSNAVMIQTTTRLSRGARLRRGAPIWIYAVLAACAAAAALALTVFKH